MKSSGWSSLFLGTILATSAFGTAWAEDGVDVRIPTVVAPLAVASEPDPAPLAPAVRKPIRRTAKVVPPAEDPTVAAIDAARLADTIAADEIDRIKTGSIAQLQAGTRTGTLSEVKPRAGSGLRELTSAPTADAPSATSTPSTPSAAAPAPAPAVAAPSVVTPPAPVAATPEPTAPVAAPAPVAETAPTETVAPLAVTPAAPAPADVATTPAAPSVEPAATVAAEPTAAPAPAATAEATPVAERPAEVAATTPAEAAPKPVEAATPAPVDTAAKPTETPTPSMVAAYSTASEPTPVAPAVAAAPASPLPAAVAVPAQPPVPVPTAATPAAVPATAVAPTADPAIAATLAAEQAAAALKTALEELQPLAGTADERADRAGLLTYYKARAWQPLFVDAVGATQSTQAAAGQLAHADRDGLELRDYALPRIEAGLAPEARAKTEIAVALTIVRYARHLQTGRFDPLRVSDLVTAKPTKTDAREVLGRLSGPNGVAAGLESYAPPHEGYRRLKALLAELRGQPKEPPMVRLPVGPTLKPGQKDARVAMLRERLGVGVASDADLYDPSLADAVKAFQRDRGLSPTGAVGRETVVALNGAHDAAADRITDVVVNMERWRWLPRDLGELHVFVNVADYHLDVMKAGTSIHHARVIVGRPANQTPIFSETMQYIVVNPYWNVPYSIVKKEMLGKAAETKGAALTRGNFEVQVGNHTVDPATVDWTTINPGTVTIRQRPGDGNALGNIKFMFPNQHSVYIHDTSSRGLFAQSYRALSHGCVRVHEPFSFADAVLSEEPTGLDGAQLKKMRGGAEKQVQLKRQVPVHIAYFTTFVDDTGKLQSRADIYGHDARVKRLLNL